MSFSITGLYPPFSHRAAHILENITGYDCGGAGWGSTFRQHEPFLDAMKATKKSKDAIRRLDFHARISNPTLFIPLNIINGHYQL